jgi:hypothetical protein
MATIAQITASYNEIFATSYTTTEIGNDPEKVQRGLLSLAASNGVTPTPASLLKTIVFTRDGAKTQNYAADDQWGGLETLANFGKVGEGYILTAVNVKSSKSALVSGEGSYSLYIFRSSADAGSGITDNDGMTRRQEAIQSGSGIVLNTLVKNTNDLTANSYTSGFTDQIHMTGTDLWFRLVTRAAIITPGAVADTLTLTLSFAGLI